MTKRTGAIALALVLGVLAGGAALYRHADAEPETPAPTAYPRPGPGLNLLALEPSPYLQLHAHNPVDWYPWGDAAFAQARAQDKPVFLSVGYSTCYWCHVMEREVFSNPEIAALMNAYFISIKVDREERPDIDDIYMTATQLLTRSGGWPNSVFLTPDGKPFFAGSYFPPVDVHGRPGFPRVLGALHDAWTNDRPKLVAAAEQVMQQLERLANLAGTAASAAPPRAAALMQQALEQLRSEFDAQNGGFGRTTKFPRAPSLDLLLTRLAQQRDPAAEEMLVRTLDAMALGGIHDQLGGGFHRYATERSWSIPHFEKMLYDNAQLVSVYARAYTLTGRPLYRRIVEGTLAYLDREMSLAEGGFASAQDAEVDGREGASYVWSRGEIEEVLGKERATAFLSVYQLVPLPGWPEAGVLRVRLPAPEPDMLAGFDDARNLLLAQRARRHQPLRDDKVLTAWNGLAIRGLVDAAAALGQPAYLRRAERAADFVLAHLVREDGTLQRSYIAGQSREDGVLDDYAFLADGLLALHAATGEQRWLVAARGLAEVLLARFEDPANGGFFLTPAGSKLLVRPKPFEDDAIPSGNGVALRVLRALSAEPGSERFAKAAAGIAASAGPLLERAPSALATLVTALAGGAVPSAAFWLPRSEDHVHARLVRSADAKPAGLAVQLRIDPGWHVNANPASLPFLVPTAVEGIEGSNAAALRYPPGRSFRPAFADEAIQVYEGTLEIPIALGASGAAPGRIAVRFQACNDTRCLPPDTAVLALDPR